MAAAKQTAVIGARKSKAAPKLTAQKTAAPRARKPDPPELWRCKVDWVRFMGRKYFKGESLLVHPKQLTNGQLQLVSRYFEKIGTAETTTVISEPIQPLAEGDSNNG